jgi:MoaA/NifB/PqqE/SkfB family radical SAM enzyme
MNILLTTACNLECGYCFAQSLKAQSGRQEMRLRDLEWLLFDYLDPRADEVRFLGGEPTLHSRYPEALRLAQSYGYFVTVFTNGTQAILRETAPDLPYQILLNLNDWQTYSEGQQAEIINNLAALGRRVSLGYTVTRPDFDLSTHQRLIREYGLKPMIRLGLAQPTIGGTNAFLANEDLPAAHRAIADWAVRLAPDSIRLNFDCGFMQCYYGEDEFAKLYRSGAVVRFFCAPALDVGPDLKAWRCYAFSGAPGVDLRRFRTIKEAEQWFERRDRYLRPECDSCRDHQSGFCDGGCLARQAIQPARLGLAPANLK